ncbi:interferon-induced, double-stranded RNA-activated protein kinase isoform X2 [Syngnathoides biaculeatus]|uniref:interferon-induced, double-stranded RNA-activated protein kinase isoform X2 n=1 Tax=Syngnathoides biaculeatus TaxID=300417 RepID=UPI002ADD5A4C|nr:interferon-induced, double-stranded RNA-activated protein kinase isoform X2 [Syngnathoides biaculeatus]
MRVFLKGCPSLKRFTIRVVVNGEEYPEGVGNSKKEAKQNAAKYALERLMEKKERLSEPSLEPVGQTVKNHVSWLYEYGQKVKMPVKFIESTRPGSYKTFQCRFFVGKIEYAVATGTTKKEAKEEAAKLAYNDITKVSLSEDDKTSGSSNQQKEDMSEIFDRTSSLKTEDDGCVETNFIGAINSYCQKTHRTPKFIEMGRSGPSHNHTFQFKLVIDDEEYAVAVGKTIKEAKQNAAQLALFALEKEDSEVLWSSLSTPSSRVSSPNLGSLDVKFKNIMTPPALLRQFDASSPKYLGKSPDCKPKRTIAANFPNATGQQDKKSAEFKDCEDNSERKSQLASSRFKQDFDSIEYINKGGFGSVYKAKHKLEGKNYAVKVACYKEKSLREILALSELQHPNIVRYYTCWMEDAPYECGSVEDSSSSHSSTNLPKRYLYIQMELCDSNTLRKLINDMNTRNVSPTQRGKSSFAIIQQIVSGVKYIHAKKLIHRDLKPANILLGLDETVKIGDFGLVTDANVSQDRSINKGTRSYMAPEQKDKMDYDRKVDIFALGLIYFELLWFMVTASERAKLWNDVRNRKFPSGLSHLFPTEEQMIKSMLCLKPEDRPEADQLQTNLEEWDNALKQAKDKKTS